MKPRRIAADNEDDSAGALHQSVASMKPRRIAADNLTPDQQAWHAGWLQ